MSLADQSQQWLTARAKVSVLQARGLRIKGKLGTDGAHVLLQVGSQKFSTPKGPPQRADPLWEGQEAAFELAGFPENSAALRVQVMQRALVGPDKLLGQSDIDLGELYSNRGRDRTEWFKLFGKPGKPEKDRGEILLDIQFLKGSMSASMFDLSSQDKSRSKIGKLKDKLRGKKKEGLSDSASAIVPSVTQVMTDSEGEEEEEPASGEKKKKNKLKSLFVPKSSLQKSTSQSMSTLSPFPERDSAVASSNSSGLNVESPEGKKKFKLFTHKRNSSTDSKVSQSGFVSKQSAPPMVCINGSHIYSEEPETKGSSLSLTSSGHGSMEELRREKEERERLEEERRRAEREVEEERRKVEEEIRRKERQEEEQRKIEEERERMRVEREKDEQRRKIEEERKRKMREEEEQRKIEEEKQREKIEEERKRKEREEKQRKIEEEKERMRVEREKEEQMEKIEEERKRKEREEKQRKIEEEKERMRVEREKEEQMEKIEEERKRKEREEKQRKMEEEKERMRVEREKEEQRRKIEEERKRKVREEEEQRKIEEEKERMRVEREKEEQREKIEEERKRKEREEKQRKIEEEKERMRMEREKEEQRKIEGERKRMERESEEQRRKLEEMERERKRIEEERRLAEEKRRRTEEEERLREEERRKMERRLTEEKVREEEERRRRVAEAEEAENRRREAEEKRVHEEKERKRREEEERREREKEERKEKQRLRMEEEKWTIEMKEEEEVLQKEEREMKEAEQEKKPVPKARTGKVSSAPKLEDPQEELSFEDRLFTNPFELSFSEQPTSTNPFEEPTDSQPTASARSARVSTVKPRQQAVKPLNAADKQSDLRETNGKAAGASDSMQPKTEAAEVVSKGPYSQLTRAELISLVIRQQEQLSQRDSRITELEQYIDNLLVRVIEEHPSILMSINSMKKAV
ncbi:golgin subfamily A member 6-like protein 22 isoform X2 [Pygocentrus nattereri]|uniref:FIP-RBD domain-containing protein n=1 Tax=Pygocentrus nattereri TaxID=42514 RepID=A0AAR2J4K2_PYGNA|nr:golgin subfamily A member 6-like protein 22 isoform X2 [Pygocentrus nattereri]